MTSDCNSNCPGRGDERVRRPVERSPQRCQQVPRLVPKAILFGTTFIRDGVVLSSGFKSQSGELFLALDITNGVTNEAQHHNNRPWEWASPGQITWPCDEDSLSRRIAQAGTLLVTVGRLVAEATRKANDFSRTTPRPPLVRRSMSMAPYTTAARHPAPARPKKQANNITPTTIDEDDSEDELMMAKQCPVSKSVSKLDTANAREEIADTMAIVGDFLTLANTLNQSAPTPLTAQRPARQFPDPGHGDPAQSSHCEGQRQHQPRPDDRHRSGPLLLRTKPMTSSRVTSQTAIAYLPAECFLDNSSHPARVQLSMDEDIAVEDEITTILSDARTAAPYDKSSHWPPASRRSTRTADDAALAAECGVNVADLPRKTSAFEDIHNDVNSGGGEQSSVG
ncbi:hypothetical protein CPLU01_15444 [Colletotrichum plurivorum]|uniref:Uncharacterized protein n=1 Tax=Colletotrichum plurivorum TaxID=2175906 RepID=A0A8H6JBV6_9PEZI|nr:hypothetical protein CPLU01_15444 [Colletotrichum plurivorum]